jgi:cell division protease FtsH
MLEHAARHKVTIVPRGQSLGAAWYLPKRLIVRPDQMLDEMCATMGGRSWKSNFNRISTGALSDLEKVTKQARAW